MNHFDVQQKTFGILEETKYSLVSERKDNLVCPKARRVGLSVNNPSRPFRSQISHGIELCESKKRAELLDMILIMDGSSTEQSMSRLISSSPPFFRGSPPSRSANPLIQDARFGEAKVTPPSPFSLSSPSGLLSPTSSSREGGCGVRTKFGLKPAAVRVEGFDCLDRDHQNSSITAVA